MSEQDYEGLDDLWSAITKAATSGHPGPNHGRIFDGCLFVTQKEWDSISALPSSKTWDDMTPVEKLSNIPIHIIPNGKSERLSDGRVLTAFADTLYLLPEPDFTVPPLPRLHVDGRYLP